MKPCNPNKIEGSKPSWERKEYLRGYDEGIKEFNYVLNKIKTEIETNLPLLCFDDCGNENNDWTVIKEIIDKHKKEYLNA